MSALPTRRRGSWASELAVGVRLVLAGGRSGWIRAAMIAVGIGLGVAMLLGAASVPSMLSRADDRSSARAIALTSGLPASRQTALVRIADTTYRGREIRGRDIQSEGPDAPVPPGLRRLPSPGTMVVSPALDELLRSAGGDLLRERLGSRVVGRMSEEGLLGPRELAFYRGSNALHTGASANAQRIDHFGDDSQREPLGPLLTLLVAIAVIVLLLPIGVFVAGAVRFGAEARDRRLAALRLLGADHAMTARVAAGETLVGAAAGVAVGVILFLAARPLAERISLPQLQQLSVFAADVRPDPLLTAAIVVGVPAAAIAASLLTLRGVVIEPLGIVRRAAATRRRLWWRVLPGLVGLALLWPLLDGLGNSESYRTTYQAAAGVLLILVGLTAVIPWLVETVVARLRGGGTLSWQLATRRLQMDAGTAARVVSGIAVAVAGAIALQSLFAAAERVSTSATGANLVRAQVQVTIGAVPATFSTGRVAASLAATPGVRSVSTTTHVNASGAGTTDEYLQVLVGSCRSLREYARIASCRDGDVFLSAESGSPPVARAGNHLALGDAETGQARWNVPAVARVVPLRLDPAGNAVAAVLATPGALSGVTLPARYIQSFVSTTPSNPDALEHVRTTAARLDPSASVFELQRTRQDRTFTQIRQAVFAAAALVLALIGACLLVVATEQLRDRRRVLAVLVAFGTRRTTMAASVLWQVALPVMLGLAMAIVVGATLGALLLSVASQPIVLDWWSIAALAGVGAVVVALVTLLSLPALWRGMRPNGLRTE